MARPDVNPCAPALIRHVPVPGDDTSTTDIRRLLPAWIISGVIHVVLLALFLLITVSSAPAVPNAELSEILTRVEDSPRDENLTNEDLGNDPELATLYNVQNIEDFSAPGPSNPNEKAGILGAPELPPQVIAPPKGFGGSGQEGGIDDPTRNGSGRTFGTRGGMGGPGMNHVFGGRTGATRMQALQEGGGNGRSEAAVAAGLKWLALHQAVDGHWSSARFHKDGKNCNCSAPGHDDDMFGTSLALLTFLGAGEAHRGVGKHSIYAKHVERGMKWMISKQNADGVLSNNNGYIQGMAALALCELYGLTADPQLKGPAQRAIYAVVNWQAADGGFRYIPKQNGDTSVTGWHIQALKSAQMAGLNVPNPTLAQCVNYLDKVSTPEGSVVGYMTPNDRPEHTRTQAIGLLCRMYLNAWGPHHPGMAKGVDILRKHMPAGAHKDMYYYYYATQVMHHFGGKEWKEWNEGVGGKPGMRDILIQRQDQGQNPERRHQKGSWDPAGDAFGNQFGRLGHTCLCILTLEVYYRHLPLFRRELGAMKDPAARNAGQ